MENKLSENYSATGTLIVTASTAGGALPVRRKTEESLS